jgi:PAS domain-containing protein
LSILNLNSHQPSRQGAALDQGLARPEKLPEDSVLWQGYFYDITESKKTEEWIGFLNTVLMNISDSVIISDVFGEIIYANRRAKDLHGYEPEDLLGKSPTMLNINPFQSSKTRKSQKRWLRDEPILRRDPAGEKTAPPSPASIR